MSHIRRGTGHFTFVSISLRNKEDLSKRDAFRSAFMITYGNDEEVYSLGRPVLYTMTTPSWLMVSSL